jgi:ribosome-associated translation inhibitor RaiA
MHIQVNSNNSIDLDEDMIRQITSLVEPELKHYREDVTGVEVYVNDTNADKGGDRDKHCTIEAHVAGMAPLAASGQAPDLLLAVKEGSRKLHRVLSSRLTKRRDARKTVAASVDEDVEE